MAALRKTWHTAKLALVLIGCIAASEASAAIAWMSADAKATFCFRRSETM